LRALDEHEQFELEWRLIGPSSFWPSLGLRELWAHRELALVLAGRDLNLRYRQTIFGLGWALLQPLIAIGVFSLVFGKFVDVESDGIAYPVFVAAGLAIWFFVSGAVTSAADSLVEHVDLVTKVWFPRLLAPGAAVLATAIDLLIATALAAVVMVIHGVAPGPQIALLPLGALAAIGLAAGAGFWLCAANVLYRDVRYALPFLLQTWLFVSPVVFPISVVDGAWKYVFALNPVAGLLEAWRWMLIDSPAPGPWLAVSAATGMLLLASGAIYFRISERRFADRI
jgi:lipopolysaccharide transport system permease protein